MKRFQKILVEAGYDIGSSAKYPDGCDGSIGPKTRDAATLWLQKLYIKLGWKWHDNDLTWLRMSDVFTDKFSDFCFTVSNGKIVAISPATTKPGKYWVKNPVTVGGVTGTGIQSEGQELGTHEWIAVGKKKWGGHKVGYAMQIAPIFVYRDGNKNNILDRNLRKIAPKWYGFFMHAMGKGFSIWNWSAGCLGMSLANWIKNVVPYFKNGAIINKNIIDYDKHIKAA